jgi:uroporphyrin-III C-methyltransferase/precorrin-2 dehydrogenase/sirohydrochlorin ferrochelatase
LTEQPQNGPQDEPQNDGALYPAFLKLAGRKVVLVGGGRVAVAKHAALSAVGARLTVVAPEIDPALHQPGTTLLARGFAPADLDGAWFVVAAATPEVNRRVAAAAEERHLFVNAVDDVAAASAFAGGVVRRGPVTLAISTGGGAPALAGLLREALDAVLPADLDRWLGEARALRPAWRADGVPMEARRPLLLEALNRLYAEKGA